MLHDRATVSQGHIVLNSKYGLVRKGVRPFRGQNVKKPKSIKSKTTKPTMFWLFQGNGERHPQFPVAGKFENLFLEVAQICHTQSQNLHLQPSFCTY